jgi:hypothetical protein
LPVPYILIHFTEYEEDIQQDLLSFGLSEKKFFGHAPLNILEDLCS